MTCASYVDNDGVVHHASLGVPCVVKLAISRKLSAANEGLRSDSNGMQSVTTQVPHWGNNRLAAAAASRKLLPALPSLSRPAALPHR